MSFLSSLEMSETEVHNNFKRFKMIPTLNGATAGNGLALPQFVQLAAQSGFIGVEFSIEEVAQLVAQTSFEEVAAIFETLLVLPAVFGLPVEWRKDEATFQDGLAKLPALADLAQRLGCTRCTTWVLPNGGVPREEYATTSLRRFGAIGQILSDNGVRLGLEFIGPHHFRTDIDNVWFYDIAGALDVVAKIEHDYQLQNIGLLVDSFHWFTTGGTTMDLASIPLEQIVHVHINDAPDVPVEAQQDFTRLLPGEGIIDLNAFLQTLAAIGYDGPVAVETFSDNLKKLPAEEAALLAGQAVAQAFAKAGIEPLRLI